MSQMTKRALVASLKELMAEKPLDKITVTDLTEHCGVNRMTFYYHFKDIYDLVEWACVEEATRALAGKKTYDTWQQGFLQILQSLQKDKVFYINVYHSISREYIEQYLYKLTYDLAWWRSGPPVCLCGPRIRSLSPTFISTPLWGLRWNGYAAA